MFIIIFTRRLAVIRTKFKVITSKLQRTASSIEFIDKCLYKGYVPVLARVTGQFINEEDRKLTEYNLIHSHLRQHRNNLKKLSEEHRYTANQISSLTGNALFPLICESILNELKLENIKQLKKKIEN